MPELPPELIPELPPEPPLEEPPPPELDMLLPEPDPEALDPELPESEPELLPLLAPLLLLLPPLLLAPLLLAPLLLPALLPAAEDWLDIDSVVAALEPEGPEPPEGEDPGYRESPVVTQVCVGVPPEPEVMCQSPVVEPPGGMLAELDGGEYELSGPEPEGVERLLDPPPWGGVPVAQTGMYR